MFSSTKMSSLKIKRINDTKLVLPRLPKKSLDWKGKKCLDVRYWCMSILGKRRSGKSSLIYTLLKEFTNRGIIVLFFVPTFYKDDTYLSMRNYLEKRKIGYQAYTSIEEEGVNNIDMFMDVNNGEEIDIEEEDLNGVLHEKITPTVSPTLGKVGCNFGFECQQEKQVTKEEKKEEKPRIKKEIEYLIIFDDMSGSLRNPSVIKLCKNSRHYKCKIILSSQSIVDLSPQTHQQLDYCVLFKNFNEQSLEQVYSKLQPNISFPEFVELYEKVTNSKTGKLNNFLLIDRANESYRVNLCDKIEL